MKKIEACRRWFKTREMTDCWEMAFLVKAVERAGRCDHRSFLGPDEVQETGKGIELGDGVSSSFSEIRPFPTNRVPWQ
jgi:hypothetical protein